MKHPPDKASKSKKSRKSQKRRKSAALKLSFTHTQHKITREIDRGRRKPTARQNRASHKSSRRHKKRQSHCTDCDSDCCDHDDITPQGEPVDAQINLLKSCMRASSDTAHCIDSGANQSLHPDERNLHNKRPSEVTGIRGVSGKRTKVHTQGKWIGIDTLHMPDTEQAIISVGQYLDACNARMIFSKNAVHLLLRHSKKRIKIGVRDSDGLYSTCVSDQILGRHAIAKINLSTHAQVLRERVNHLHRCLGHISKERMAIVIKNNNFTNLKVSDLELLSCCDACNSAKIRRRNRPKPEPKPVKTRRRKRAKNPKTKPKAPRFGHTVVADSTSRQPIQTPSGKRYANVMIDVHSKWTWVTLLRSLKETLDKCTGHVLKQLQPLTKIFRADMGSEFTNSRTKQLLDKMGIRIHFACSDEHYQNGLAECTIRILQNMTRTLLADSKLPQTFWGEAMICSCFLKNRLPIKGLNGMSPYEKRYGKKFDMRRLRPFGSHCTEIKHHSDIDGQKSRLRSYKGIMCGYGDPFGQKGWRVYVPKLKRVLTSTNVLFFNSMEDSLNHRPDHLVSDCPPTIDLFTDVAPDPTVTNNHPATAPTAAPSSPSIPAESPHPSTQFRHEINAPSLLPPQQEPLLPDNHDNDSDSPDDEVLNESRHDHDFHHMPASTSASAAPEPVSANAESPQHVRPVPPPPPRRSRRLRRKRGAKHVTPSARDIQTGPQLASSRAKRDLNKLVRLMLTGTTKATCQQGTGHAYFSTMERIQQWNAYVTVAQNPLAGDIALPESYEQAMRGPYARQWKKAIKSEVQSLRDKNVFKLVDRRSLPKDANIITAKWVFKVKPNPDGSIERFKCRLCARGFLQKHGVDYSATLSPVAQAATIKLLLAIAAEKRMHLRQADVSTALLSLWRSAKKRNCVHGMPSWHRPHQGASHPFTTLYLRPTSSQQAMVRQVKEHTCECWLHTYKV